MKKKKKAELMMIERQVKDGRRMTKSLAEWAIFFEHLQLPSQTIIYRVLTLGWETERAFTTPKKEINYNPHRSPRLEKKKIKTAMLEKTIFKHKGEVVKESKFKMIEWRGQRKSLNDWCIELAPKLGISANSIEIRIKRGWDIEKAFTTSTVKPHLWKTKSN
jgi:hypothetical protein